VFSRRAALVALGCLATTILFAGVAVFPAPAHSATPTKVRFRLDWKPGAQHAVFYLARERGYYAKEGIDLEIISGSGSADSVKTLGTRAVEIALVDALVLVQAREQQVPAQAVAAYYQRTPISIMSPKAKPIRTAQEMLGKKIGSKKGSATSQGLTLFLQANGIRPEQIQMVDIGFGVQPLLVGQVDAMMGFTMNEPIEAETAGMPIHEIMIADAGVKAYGLTVSANERFIREQGDLVRGFLRASRQAMLDAEKDPQAAVAAVAKAVPEINIARELKVMAKTIPVWVSEDTRANGYGWQTEAGWQQTVDTVTRLKLVEKAPSVKELFTVGFLK
jgi:NitT/TauT family transport system substrate-binding protein